MNTVRIKGKEYNVKFSYRTYMFYEEYTDGKSIQEIKGLKDTLTLFYCSLKAYNDFEYSFEQFLDLIEDDNNAGVVEQLTKMFIDSVSRVKKKELVESSEHASEPVPIKRLYAIAVAKCGVSPEYFLDSMTSYELNALLEYSDEVERNEWEKIRMMCFYSVAPHATDKRLTPQKIMPFGWDDKIERVVKEIDIDNDKNRIDELLKNT